MLVTMRKYGKHMVDLDLMTWINKTLYTVLPSGE